ncbi:unnamed protein product [Bursaphelenchus okinawaensis]|uniref:non-specific protein-tyrosine kinase n=1 Tax=Bursaphelenchus okinawaensis TaxID=465554 RepID=A0A811LKQ3_9BILA|nr:unnamed protein product [Bursaphelenchus okinawaensis]CAG9124259.1 unnamed protein product [Bursaphelenchus okinawaensis]
MVQIEQSLHEAFISTDLISFEHKLAVEKQLTRISHFDVVTDEELKSYGLSAPAIRRLRLELDRRKKTAKKLFGSKQKTIKVIEVAVEHPAPHQSHSNPFSPSLIPKDELKIMQKLGEGTFASVRYGLWQRGDSKKECAIKVLHQITDAGLEDLFSEVGNMQKLKHENVVQLFGIVLGEQTMMVLEYCDGGALLNRLRSDRKPVLEVTTLLNYAVQIVSGMEYLEGMRVVHRDLAARNLLLTQQDAVIKICDFGLTRSLDENARFYEMSAQKKVPFAWCPPESLRFRQFSHKSDCWAFGVTLWELYTYGEEPWAGNRAADVLRITEEGQRLRKPQKALMELYNIMLTCWEKDPEKRPKFSHLKNILNEIRFITSEAREDFVSGDSDCLEVSKGDHLVMIGEHSQSEWYGQSLRTRKFGRFPKSLISVKAHKSSQQQQTPFSTAVTASTPISITATPAIQDNSNISKPVPGSLIHAGHGDMDENRCWGQIDKIDDVYLKNPVVKPLYNEATRQRGVSFIQSITALKEDIQQIEGVTVTNNMPPVGGNVVRPVETLQFDPLKAWDLDPKVMDELESQQKIRIRTNTHERGDPERRRTTNITEDLLKSTKMGMEAGLVGQKPRSSTPQNHSKYSQAIAIPRPKPSQNAFQPSSGTTDFPTKFDDQPTTTHFQAQNVSTTQFQAHTDSTTQFHSQNTTQFPSQPTTTSQSKHNSAQFSSQSTTQLPSQTYQSPFQVNRSEPDPFVIDHSIKSLTLKEPLNVNLAAAGFEISQNGGFSGQSGAYGTSGTQNGFSASQNGFSASLNGISASQNGFSSAQNDASEPINGHIIPRNGQFGANFGPAEWRQSVPVSHMHQRAESARTTKEFTPLDNSILALLDPLVAKNPKVAQPSSTNGPENAQNLTKSAGINNATGVRNPEQLAGPSGSSTTSKGMSGASNGSRLASTNSYANSTSQGSTSGNPAKALANVIHPSKPQIQKQKSAEDPFKTTVRPRPSSSVARPASSVFPPSSLLQRPASTTVFGTSNGSNGQQKQGNLAEIQNHQALGNQNHQGLAHQNTMTIQNPNVKENLAKMGVPTVLTSVPKLHAIPNDPDSVISTSALAMATQNRQTATVLSSGAASGSNNRSSAPLNPTIASGSKASYSNATMPSGAKVSSSNVSSASVSKISSSGSRPSTTSVATTVVPTSTRPSTGPSSTTVAQNTSFLSDSAYGTTRSITSFDSSYGSLNASVSSFLPPPSDLLLNGKKAASYSKVPTKSQVFTTNHSNPTTTSTTKTTVPQKQPIPFLMPTPLPQSEKPVQQATNGPPIDLNDLDIDRMISDVKKNADFASHEQCTKALRAHEYEVEKAVQFLKLAKFMELGLSPSKEAAQLILNNHQWDLNAAASSLIK